MKAPQRADAIPPSPVSADKALPQIPAIVDGSLPVQAAQHLSPPSSGRWIRRRLHGSLGTHAADWDRLNTEQFGENPLLTSLFINHLISFLSDGSEQLCILTQCGTVRAMCLLKPCGQLAWESFLPSQARLGPTLIPDAAMLPGLIECLPGLVCRLDLLCNDPAVGGVVNDTSPPTDRMNHALTIRVSIAGSFEQYWAARSKNLQSNIKHYQSSLELNRIAMRTFCISEAAEVSLALKRFADLEGSGWKGEQGTALDSNDAQFRFLTSLMAAEAAQGTAYVFELWFDSTLVASRLIIKNGRSLVLMKTSYDKQWAEYAPGRLQLHAMLQYCFAYFPGYTIEWDVDANNEQLEWATGQRWIQHATVYRNACISSLWVTLRGQPSSRALHVGSEAPLIEVFNEVSQLPDNAVQLLVEAEKRGSTLGAAWYENLTKTVYPGLDSIKFYVLSRGEHCLAVLPLRIENNSFITRVNSLTNFYSTLYEPVVASTVKPTEMVPVLEKILRSHPRTASLTFAQMDPASHGYQTLLAALRRTGLPAFEYFAFGNWYLKVPPTWAEYLKTRSSTMRNTIKRMGKKFEADHGSIKIATQPDEMDWAIAAYERVYAASWKVDEPYPEFMPGLLRMCAAKGWLRLGVACLGEQAVAAQAWIVLGGRAEIYKVAYDEKFKHYSPGTLLTAAMMQRAFELDQVVEVDYLIGDDAYKKTWMSDRRERWGIVAYNPATLAGLIGLLREFTGRALKPWIQKLRHLKLRREASSTPDTSSK